MFNHDTYLIDSLYVPFLAPEAALPFLIALTGNWPGTVTYSTVRTLKTNTIFNIIIIK